MSGGVGVPMPPGNPGGGFGPDGGANKRGLGKDGRSRRASRGATGKGGAGKGDSAPTNGDGPAPDPRTRYDPKYDSFTRGLGAPGSSAWNAGGSTGFTSQWPNLPPAGVRGPATPSVSSSTSSASSSAGAKFPDILRDTYKPQPPTIRTGKWPYNYVNVATGGLSGTPSPGPNAPPPTATSASTQSGPTAAFRTQLQSGKYQVEPQTGADKLRNIASGARGPFSSVSPASATSAPAQPAPAKAPAPTPANAANAPSNAPSTPAPKPTASRPPRPTNAKPRPRVGSKSRGPTRSFTIKSADGLGYPLGPAPLIAMIGAPLCYYGYTSAPKMAVMDKQTLKAEG